MNSRELSKQVGRTFRLRPVPFQRGSDGARLPPSDDYWLLEAITGAPATLRLANHDGRVIELQSDNIQEFRSPEFLMLRCQLTLTPDRVELEPLHKGTPIQPGPQALAAVLSEIEAAPLLSRRSLEESFRGLLVGCTAPLGSLEPVAEDVVRVGLMFGREDVFFEVSLTTYPQLRLARARDEVKVEGHFRLGPIGSAVWLDDAKLVR
jgi:hypothetical protein